ncbi:MAG: glutathione S-transferase [Deltaproteobacteria bacterium]
MKLYTAERSGHAHTVRNFLSILGVACEHVELSTADRETRKEPFLAINPFGQIPALDDDGFVVRDSHAILVYLAKKYDDANRWLPEDPEGAARVAEWLATSTIDLVIGAAWARAITHFGRPWDLDAAQKRAERLLALMESHLEGRTWLAADHATIADISMYSYTARAPEGGVALEPYENVRAWLERVEAIEGFTPMIHL